MYVSRGYVISGRNVRSNFGEVDIIAENAEYICFVEVKTRKAAGMRRGALAVDKAKQKRLLRTADIYLQEHPDKGDKAVRFDVAEVVITDSDRPDFVEAEIFEGAFDATDVTIW